jgi:hypothetical protein
MIFIDDYYLDEAKQNETSNLYNKFKGIDE